LGEPLINIIEDLSADEWSWAQREELREQYLEALLTLGALLFAVERYGEAADAYRQVIVRDNLLEAAHRELIRCYARLGERGQALRQYQALVNLLGDELGAPPEPQTEALFERLRKGKPV